MSRQDAIPKTRRESFDLALDSLGHVKGRAVRDVAVSPNGVLARRGARGVEERLLHEQHVRFFGMLALPRVTFGLRDLGQRAAEMNGDRARTILRLPRDRPVEREIHFEHARSVAKFLQSATIARRESRSGNLQ